MRIAGSIDSALLESTGILGPRGSVPLVSHDRSEANYDYLLAIRDHEAND